MSSDTRLIKKAIIDFSHSQLPNGMLQANYPSRDVQVIPTFSLYWIFLIREYLRCAGDAEIHSEKSIPITVEISGRRYFTATEKKIYLEMQFGIDK